MKRILFIVCTIIFFACGNNSENKPDLEGSNIPEIMTKQKNVEKNPQNPEAYIQLAQAYYKYEGYDEAIQIVKRAISLDSTQARYYRMLSDVYFQYNKSFDAITVIQQASGMFPDSLEIQLDLARKQNFLKQYDQSIQTLNRVVSSNIANDEVYYILGTNYRYLGQTERALSNLKVAVELNADNLLAYQDLAIMCDTLGKDQLSLQYFENALRIDSTNMVTLFARGDFHNRRLQDKDAISWYRKVAKYNKDYAEPYFNIGLIYMDNDSIVKANKHFNMVVQMEPTHSLGYYYRGLSSQMLGNKASAINDFKQALNINPDLTRAKQALKDLGENVE